MKRVKALLRYVTHVWHTDDVRARHALLSSLRYPLRPIYTERGVSRLQATGKLTANSAFTLPTRQAIGQNEASRGDDCGR